MKINMRGSGKVNIDGRDFHGRSVTIVNGKVTVDGIEQLYAPGLLFPAPETTLFSFPYSRKTSA